MITLTRAWAVDDILNVPEKHLGVLGDVRGLDVAEPSAGLRTCPPGWPGKEPGRSELTSPGPACFRAALPSGQFDLAVSECGAIAATIRRCSVRGNQPCLSAPPVCGKLSTACLDSPMGGSVVTTSCRAGCPLAHALR